MIIFSKFQVVCCHGKLLGALLLLAVAAEAQSVSDPVEFDIGAQSLAGALLDFSRQAEMQVLYKPADVEGQTSPGLQGAFEPLEALSRLLQDTGLEIRPTAEGTVAIVPSVPVPTAAVEAAPRFSARQSYPEEIIVTAARREQPVSDLPMSVTVVSADVLAESWFTEFNELANWVPSFSARNGNPLLPDYVIRGLVSTSVGGRSVDFLIDGATAVNIFGTSSPALLDYDRIEVIRGAQGTLYGQNSLAGTVKFVSVVPRYGETEGDFAASGWTTSNGDDSWRGRALVNLPIGDRVAVRLGASYEDQGGFIDAYSVDPETLLPDELIKKNINYGKRTAFRGAVAWQATDRFEMYLTARQQSLDAPFSTQERLLRAPPGGDSLVPFDDYRAAPTTTEFEKVPGADESLATLEAVYDFDSVSLTSETTYYRDEREAAFTSVQTIPGGIVLARSIESIEEQENRSQEIRLTSRQGDRLDWIAGAFWREESYSQASTSENLGDGSSFSSGENTNRVQKSIYGNVRYNATDRFALEAGVRWFNEDADRERVIRISAGDFDLPPSMLEGSGDFETTSPRFALLFDLADDVLFFAGVSKGFRGGTINLAENLPAELATADPDSNWSYELGLKGRWLDGRLGADVVAFYNDWDDIQARVIEVVDGQTFNVAVNGESAHTLGVEWQVNWRPTDSFGLSFAGHVMDSELDSSIRGESGGIRAGNELTFAPRWGASVRADWAKPIGFNREAYVGLNLMTRAGSFSSLSNEPVSKTPSYDQGNATIGLRAGAWDASLYATNIWNERGYLSQQGAFGPFNQVGFGNVIVPRRVGLTIRYGF